MNLISHDYTIYSLQNAPLMRQSEKTCGVIANVSHETYLITHKYPITGAFRGPIVIWVNGTCCDGTVLYIIYARLCLGATYRVRYTHCEPYRTWRLGPMWTWIHSWRGHYVWDHNHEMFHPMLPENWGKQWVEQGEVRIKMANILQTTFPYAFSWHKISL